MRKCFPLIMNTPQHLVLAICSFVSTHCQIPAGETAWKWTHTHRGNKCSTKKRLRPAAYCHAQHAC